MTDSHSNASSDSGSDHSQNDGSDSEDVECMTELPEPWKLPCTWRPERPWNLEHAQALAQEYEDMPLYPSMQPAAKTAAKRRKKKLRQRLREQLLKGG